MAEVLLLDRRPAPFARTSLFGREAAIAGAQAQLLDDATSCLTLTGPGGVGKTRLVLAVAAAVGNAFAEGIIWVDLAPVAVPSLVPLAVATAVGLPPVSDRPIAGELTRFLRPRQTLLILDNCEHVLAGVAELVADLLAHCPALQVLASSRAPLHIRGEQVSPVEPLALPPEAAPAWQLLAENDAVRLFVDRARAQRRGFTLTEANAAAVAAICRAVDGLPLAIELAAARMTILSPEAILAQMTDRLSLLRDGPRDAPNRQQTIEAAIGWSYELLSPDERALCRRLSVFTGGFTLDAARCVSGSWSGAPPDIVDGFNALVNHSLVQRVERDGEPRFTTLQTIRAFGGERLAASAEEAETRSRHASYYCEYVEASKAWMMPHLPDSEQLLDQLEVEYPNLRGALSWLREIDDVSGLLALAGGLGAFWTLRGHLHDGRAWLEWGLTRDAEVPASIIARSQIALSRILGEQHEPREALTLVEKSLDYCRCNSDAVQYACAAAQAASRALQIAGPRLTNQYIDEALASLAPLEDAMWARVAVGSVLWLRAVLAKDQGDLSGAERYLRQVIELQRAIAQESDKDQLHACLPYLTLGSIKHVQGATSVALKHYQTSLDLAWRLQVAKCAAHTVARIAGMVAVAGRWQEAAWMFGATEAFCDKAGFAFTDDIWLLTRAFGLPQPWQGPEDFTGQSAGMRAETLQRAADPVPPLPDPAAAAELWAAGRGVPIEEAVAHALAVALAPLDSPRPKAVITRLQAGPATVVSLSRREQEVLALLCQRRTNAEIAELLFLSVRTIEDYVTGLLGKLGASNRRDAAAIAVRRGLVSPVYALSPAQFSSPNPYSNQ